MSTTHTDRLKKLQDRLEKGNPESWQPSNAGEEVFGTLISVEVGHTAFGDAVILVIQDAESFTERSVWLLHTVLRNQVNRLRPQYGEMVGIRYLGKRRPEGGGPEYDDYRVVVDRDRGATVAWDKLLGETDRELPDPTEALPDEPAAAGQEFPTSPVDDDIPF
jgi:hypothetical protein